MLTDLFQVCRMHVTCSVSLALLSLRAQTPREAGRLSQSTVCRHEPCSLLISTVHCILTILENMLTQIESNLQISEIKNLCMRT